MSDLRSFHLEFPLEFSLEGRLALVTGSSRGIGLAMARALGRAGGIVVLNSRSVDALSEAAAALESENLAVHVRSGDVTDPDFVQRMIAEIESDLGPLEVLVNNAGIQHRGALLEFPLDSFRALVETNLVAAFLVARAAARPMVERGRGKIINICSVLSSFARPTASAYAATKGGLQMLTRGLCAELGPSGIQVNAIAPGYFATDLTGPLVDDPEFSSWISTRTPAGRWGSVEELGGAAVFLASDASSYVNGHTLVVDGGMTAVL